MIILHSTPAQQKLFQFFQTSLNLLTVFQLSSSLPVFHSVLTHLPSSPLPSPFSVGSVLCDVERPVKVCLKFQARIIVFNPEYPVTPGFPVGWVLFSVLLSYGLDRLPTVHGAS